MRAKVLQGRKSINWANSVLPEFMGALHENSPQNCRMAIKSTPPDFRRKPMRDNDFQTDRFRLTGQQWDTVLQLNGSPTWERLRRRYLQTREELGFMQRQDVPDRLQFQHHLVSDDDIGAVAALERDAVILRRQVDLPCVRHSLPVEFAAKATSVGISIMPGARRVCTRIARPMICRRELGVVCEGHDGHHRWSRL